MSEQPTGDKLLSLGRLNIKKTQDGKTYYVGNILVKNLKQATVFTDKFGNKKIGLYITDNAFKDKEGDADLKIFESRKPDPTKAKGYVAGADTTAPAADKTDLPF